MKTSGLAPRSFFGNKLAFFRNFCLFQASIMSSGDAWKQVSRPVIIRQISKG